MMLMEYRERPTAEQSRQWADIAAGLAHEVRNPLSIVKCSIDLLESGETSALATKQYKLIRRELERINELMAEFIEFTGQKPARRAPFQAAPVARGMVETFADAYKDVAFTVTCGCPAVFVLGDQGQISRVLMNLLKNAVEAIAAAGAKGRVDVTLSQSGGEIEISVRDNGVGVTEKDAEKALLPFYTTKADGTGLGLYICQSIIAEHGGRLTITPNEGAGATAALILPVFAN